MHDYAALFTRCPLIHVMNHEAVILWLSYLSITLNSAAFGIKTALKFVTVLLTPAVPLSLENITCKVGGSVCTEDPCFPVFRPVPYTKNESFQFFF